MNTNNRNLRIGVAAVSDLRPVFFVVRLFIGRATVSSARERAKRMEKGVKQERLTCMTRPAVERSPNRMG